MQRGDDNPENSDIDHFEIAALKILTRLTFSDNIDDEIIESLRDMELEYDSLMKKYLISEEKANIDAKTTLLKYNEEFLVNIVKTLSRYWQSSQKHVTFPISYIRLDLDDFSRINNTHGHDAGDRVLQALGQALKKVSRPTDYLFRFGGEEFDVVLPLTPLDGAEIYLQKLIREIREIRVPLPEGNCIGVTASIGLTIFDLDFAILKQVFPDYVVGLYQNAQKQADQACYEAKWLGKDRYCIWREGVDYAAIQKDYGSRVKK
jgi:diguanylate cyclase